MRTVGITGGARGIGPAAAEAPLREGFSVAICDIDGALCGAVVAGTAARSAYTARIDMQLKAIQ
jgi:NAD(P)-dependent dehydrogenase (short-subunit alcohol dehydrogenase family)